MDDLISRQAAIDVLESIGSLDTEADRQYARTVFENLPSAQPYTTTCTTACTTTDTISRQAAIDAMCGACSDWCDEGVCRKVSAIQKLPPAPPKIIRCKDCDWWTKQEDSLQGRCARYGMYPTGYWYCAAARERDEE